MAKERLDKIIASMGRYSRREVKQLVKDGQILVDGKTARSAEEKYDPETAEILPVRRSATGVIPTSCCISLQAFCRQPRTGAVKRCWTFCPRSTGKWDSFRSGGSIRTRRGCSC